jgi:hypothetical protein
MPWVISNTSDRNPMLYCFDVSAVNGEWELAGINSATYGSDGAIIVTPQTLEELSSAGVAIFETKSSAKIAFKELGITTCRYVQLRIPSTKLRACLRKEDD